MGPRELAEAGELLQRYIDYLDALEVAPIDAGVTIEIDGEKVRFESPEQLSEFLAGEMK
jgi:hypothetical protein